MHTLLTRTLLLVAMWSVCLHAQAQSAQKQEASLDTLKQNAKRLSTQSMSMLLVRQRASLEDRFRDGQQHFQRGQYFRASLFFTDILQNYRPGERHAEALYMLARSLLRAGDSFGARSHFVALLEKATRSADHAAFAKASALRLVALEARTHRFKEVVKSIDTYRRWLEPEVIAVAPYFKGRALFEQTDVVPGKTMSAAQSLSLAEASKAFASVPVSSVFALQATYFVGVIHSIQKDYGDAISAFSRVTKDKGKSKRAKVIVSLAHLALGRIYYELDQIEAAARAYKQIASSSEFYDIALYEQVWVYLRAHKYGRAEATLRRLALAYPSSPLILEGDMLLGNLYLRDGFLKKARSAFLHLRQRVSPAHKRFARVRQQQPDMHAFFLTRIQRTVDRLDAEALAPNSGKLWLEYDDRFNRSLATLNHLKAVHADFEETQSMAELMAVALRQPTVVRGYPRLGKSLRAAIAIRNKLALLKLELVGKLYAEQGSTEKNAEHGKLLRRRAQLMVAVNRLPKDMPNFAARDYLQRKRYEDIRLELSRLRVELKGLRARLQFFSRFKADTSNQALNQEVKGHEQQSLSYQDDLDRLDHETLVGLISVGYGDHTYQRDQKLRDEITALVQQELAFYPNAGAVTKQQIADIEALESSLSSWQGQSYQQLRERVAVLEKAVDEIYAKLEDHENQLKLQLQETELLVADATVDAYHRATKRFEELLTRANVGLVDVAWQRRELSRLTLEYLNRKRAEQLKAVDRDYQETVDQPSISFPGGS